MNRILDRLGSSLCLTIVPVTLPAIMPAIAGGAAASQPASRWTAEKANQWYAALPWLVGCDFIPSTAVNQLEMWQAETFDEATIDRELGWAADIGMNTVRVYLHDLAWQADPDGFKQRMNRFLRIADKHHIRPLFVIFDDCWNDNPKIGKQPDPIPGVHNSGWMQSPGKAVVNNPAEWGRLERYVRDVIGTFGQDRRVLLWDLYNEPGNSEQHLKSLPLLKKVFEWARAAGPSQPLSAGLWYDNKELNEFQLAASDVITFHNYNDAKSLTDQIAELKKHGRPVICTEWMRRPVSVVQSHLPIFARHRVGCINWGLVSGKTQTIYPWGSKQGAPEPKPWFHDLFHKDGTPYDPAEIAMFKELSAKIRKGQ
ncbi:MAG TPA: cellulase family glycosylhydrolase [Phycisphaerae bacterium]|nr:cellulase family glycosylhydrolase [Phycisphaerae bacterium]HRR87172.1 cellulase family glycosylhydrolase [Phycisphaerae bacterium]